MKTMKKVLVFGAATIALVFSGCAGDYVVGTYVPGVYGGPYYGPYYGGYGPLLRLASFLRTWFRRPPFWRRFSPLS